MDVEDQLRDAFRRSVDGLDPPVRELVAGAVREARASRRSTLVPWAAGAAAATVVVTAVAVTRPWDDPRTGEGPADAPTSCHSEVREEVLPTWARTGFSDPEPVVAHVMSDHRRIVAILFGRVLHSPPAEDVNNKILWVARSRGADPLSIEAVRAGDGRVAHREVPGGPGPSTVDLPGPGCWRLSLRWGDEAGRRDTMELEYVDPR